MNWREHLQTCLLDIQPASLCVLDETARQLARDVLPGVRISMLNPPPDIPCALALGIDALNELDDIQAQNLISQIRLYAAPRMLLAARFDCALDEDAFRALGFALSARDDVARIRVFHYDIDTYKSVPDWLNSRHWAHPERWEP